MVGENSVGLGEGHQLWSEELLFPKDFVLRPVA